jgi:L-arabinokinase
VSTSTDSRRGSAPGRLDLLGGVADYSGALVLEIPTRVETTVVAEPNDALVVGPAMLRIDEVAELARAPYDAVRAALAPFPKWTHYVLGVAIVLVRHDVIDPPRARLEVSSDVPQSVGVSSSAALEVATARALVSRDVDPLRVASLCQEAENHVVGAPCGVMDQVTVAVGVPDAVLPILCRPASVSAPVPLPAGIEVVGWPTGAEHDVSGAPYRRARVAAFIGKRIAEDATNASHAFVSEVPADALASLPETLSGAEFLERWGTTDDRVTTVDPSETYPVQAATRFGVEEHVRTTRALAAIEGSDVGALGALLAASHAGYDAIGLGHPAATAARDLALACAGVHGARSSGGGCGGTVVVVCTKGALDGVDRLVR